MTDRSLSSTNLTCSQDCHTSTLVSNPPQRTTRSLCWLDTTYRRSPRQCFLSSSEPAEWGSVFCHLLPWCYMLGAPRLAPGADSLMCCTVKQQPGRRWPTCRRMLSMLLAFFTAVAFCFLLDPIPVSGRQQLSVASNGRRLFCYLFPDHWKWQRTSLRDGGTPSHVNVCTAAACSGVIWL